MKELSRFLSRTQLERIAARSEEDSQPWREERPGAVLFVDAEGFTALTNRHAARGELGVEELSHLVNATFGRIADLVLEHGGDVIGFAGDSALALWPAGPTPEALAESTAAAARAGLALQVEMRTQGSGAGAALGVRASVGAGTLAVLELGGLGGRWHLLVAGDPVLQAVEADRRARPGDVVLSPSAWELVRDRASATLVAGGAARLVSLTDDEVGAAAGGAGRTDVDVSRERLLSYLPRVVADRVAAGHERWLGEFRDVTVAFVALGGVSPDDARALEVLHRAAATVQRILGSREGLLHHLTVDDKGTTLIAVFGLPPLSHANDAARCIHSALELREALAGAGVDSSIGVSTGLAFCGVYGSARRCDYTVLGPVMHRAARLMQGARGILFCDEATMRAAGVDETLAFDHLPPIRVKGEDAPVMVFAPRRGEAAAGATRRPRGTMVGRVREIAALERSLAGMLDERRGAVFLLTGEEGIGKSTLVEHLIAEASEAAALCLRGSASETERGTPYHAWRPVLDALSVEPIETSGPVEGAEVRAENLRRRVAERIREACAARPAVLVLEELQWADSASWALILEVVRRVDSILFVGTMRPAIDPPVELEALRAARGFRSIELGMLSRDEIGRLIRDRLGGRAIDDAVVDLIHERTGGHPFFAEELAFTLSDSGALSRLDELSPHDARDDLERFLGGTIPDTVRGVILRRVDRLDPARQMSLRVASVIGHRFDVDLLADIHPDRPGRDALLGDLRSLAELDLVRPGSADEERWAFRSRITREVAYHSMPFERRRDLHRRIAEWHESRGVGRRFALVGHHWRGADDAARASEWMARAGEQALREHANRDAVRFLSEALELSPDDPSTRAGRARWRLWIGRALVNLSRYDEAVSTLEAGLAAFREKAPRSAGGTLPRLASQAALQGLHRLWPGRYLGREAANRESLLQLVNAYEGLVEAHYIGGRALPTLFSAVRALNLSEIAGPSGALARSYASTGAILGFVPLRRAAEAYARWALETVRAVDEPAAEAWVSLATGVYKAGTGRWDEAIELLERVRAISRELGDRRRWEDATQHLATVAYLRGRLRESLELAGQLATSAAGEAGLASDLDAPRGGEPHPMRQADALVIAIAALLRLGSAGEIDRRVEELDRVAGDHPDALGDRGPIALAAVRGQRALRRGRYDEARATAEGAVLGHAPRNVASYESLLDYWSLAEVLFAGDGPPARGGSGTAERRVVKALAAHARVFPVCRPATEIARGLLARAGGRTAAAQSAFRLAARVAEDLAMPWFEAIARYHLARSLSEAAPERDAQIDRAYGILDGLGASFDLELVRREVAARVRPGVPARP